MHEIRLGDVLTFEPAKELRLEMKGPVALAPDPENLVLRAARLLQEHTGTSQGAAITLEKHVPVGAGLGGGSADAAATLQGLNHLWQLGLATDALHELASRLGSDINFFLVGKTCLCTGRGEIVESLNFHPRLHLALLCPPFGTSTAGIFRKFQLDLTHPPRRARTILTRLRTGEPGALKRVLFNRLETAIFSAEPRMVPVFETARRKSPYGARVTGSGSTVYMVTSSEEEARNLIFDDELSALGHIIPTSSV